MKIFITIIFILLFSQTSYAELSAKKQHELKIKKYYEDRQKEVQKNRERVAKICEQMKDKKNVIYPTNVGCDFACARLI